MTDAEKQKQWKELQARAPEIATALKLTKQTFGAYELKSVRWL